MTGELTHVITHAANGRQQAGQDEGEVDGVHQRGRSPVLSKGEVSSSLAGMMESPPDVELCAELESGGCSEHP